MNQLTAIDIIQNLIVQALLLAAPILATAVIVGVVVSVIQSVTSIQEQTLSFVPKLVASAGIFLFVSSWMIQTITEFCTRIFSMIPDMAL